VLFRGLAVVVDRHRVVLTSDAAVLATARWDGRRLTERTGTLEGWDELEEQLALDEADALAAAAVGSVDEAGVDLTLIDWMLELTPTERLQFLRSHAATLAPFVPSDDSDAAE
jgi:hypothetical protein